MGDQGLTLVQVRIKLVLSVDNGDGDSEEFEFTTHRDVLQVKTIGAVYHSADQTTLNKLTDFLETDKDKLEAMSENERLRATNARQRKWIDEEETAGA